MAPIQSRFIEMSSLKGLNNNWIVVAQPSLLISHYNNFTTHTSLWKELQQLVAQLFLHNFHFDSNIVERSLRDCEKCLLNMQVVAFLQFLSFHDQFSHVNFKLVVVKWKLETNSINKNTVFFRISWIFNCWKLKPSTHARFSGVFITSRVSIYALL
jgi:hypothetical protein